MTQHDLEAGIKGQIFYQLLSRFEAVEPTIREILSLYRMMAHLTLKQGSKVKLDKRFTRYDFLEVVFTF